MLTNAKLVAAGATERLIGARIRTLRAERETIMTAKREGRLTDAMCRHLVSVVNPELNALLDR